MLRVKKCISVGCDVKHWRKINKEMMREHQTKKRRRRRRSNYLQKEEKIKTNPKCLAKVWRSQLFLLWSLLWLLLLQLTLSALIKDFKDFWGRSEFLGVCFGFILERLFFHFVSRLNIITKNFRASVQYNSINVFKSRKC